MNSIKHGFVYAAWFRDETLVPLPEHDDEWVACILIQAQDKVQAKEWGDHLAKGMCRRNPNEVFLSSEALSVDDPFYPDTSLDDLPVVAYGCEASDEEIGW